MKTLSIHSILIVLLLLFTISCVGPKNQLEYKYTPYEIYSFGNNKELSMQMPAPTLGDPYNLYSNYLRWEWIGSGFANYFTISTIRVTEEKVGDDKENVVTVCIRTGPQGKFTLWREIVFRTGGKILKLTVMTSMYGESPYSKAMIDRFVYEDSVLFEKILNTIQLKIENGKTLKIKLHDLDNDKLPEKTQRIYLTPKTPSETFEIPYELVESK